MICAHTLPNGINDVRDIITTIKGTCQASAFMLTRVDASLAQDVTLAKTLLRSHHLIVSSLFSSVVTKLIIDYSNQELPFRSWLGFGFSFSLDSGHLPRRILTELTRIWLSSIEFSKMRREMSINFD